MHPVLRSVKPGRAGSPLNYGLQDRAMPAPPPHAKKIHDLVIIESTADPLLKRGPKWNKSVATESYKKFSRDISHMKVDNICTSVQYMNDPDLKDLQCWYFPRPTTAKDPEKPAKFLKALKPSQLVAREDMWGAWNVSVEVETPKQRRHNLRRSTRDNLQNSENYYEKNSERINELKELHRGGYRFKHFKPKMDLLKRRKGDVEAVHNLL